MYGIAITKTEGGVAHNPPEHIQMPDKELRDKVYDLIKQVASEADKLEQLVYRLKEEHGTD